MSEAERLLMEIREDAKIMMEINSRISLKISKLVDKVLSSTSSTEEIFKAAKRAHTESVLAHISERMIVEKMYEIESKLEAKDDD